MIEKYIDDFVFKIKITGKILYFIENTKYTKVILDDIEQFSLPIISIVLPDILGRTALKYLSPNEIVSFYCDFLFKKSKLIIIASKFEKNKSIN